MVKLIFTVTRLLPLLVCGCIHVDESETSKIDLKNSEELTFETSNLAALEIQSMVYHPSDNFLRSFFIRLNKGEFSDAFGDLNFDVVTENTDNKALERMLDEGFVPVYLNAMNKGTKNINLKEFQFNLNSQYQTARIISNDSLPGEFEKFNASALGANIYNTGVLVLSSAAIVIGMTSGGTRGGGRSPFSGTEKVYNSTTKTTNIDYNKYLFQRVTLEPNQSFDGLVFFKFEDSVANWQNVKFSVKSISN